MVLGSTQPLIEMSTRNISWWGDKGGRYVGLTTLPPSSAICLEIWEPQPPGTLMACQGLYRNFSSLVTIRNTGSLLKLRKAGLWSVRWPFCPTSVGRKDVAAHLAMAENRGRQTSFFQKSKYFRLRGPRGRGKIEDMYCTGSEIICINCITNNNRFLYFFLPYLKKRFKTLYVYS